MIAGVDFLMSPKGVSETRQWSRTTVLCLYTRLGLPYLRSKHFPHVGHCLIALDV